MTVKNPLVGRTLTGLKVASDGMALLFQTTEGDIVAKCDADCCSHTWIEGIELPVSFPAVVSAVEDIPLNEGADDQDGELAFYGLKVTTDRGHIVIDYRNESNGYYGGNLTWPGDHHYGGVYGQNESNMDWTDPQSLTAREA